MRRILLNQDGKQLDGSMLDAAPRPKVKVSQAELERRLREKRSNRYLETLRSLDAGHLAVDSKEYQSLIAAIHEELPDPDALLGLVAKCYLGDPYEVHTLDASLDIIEHYPPNKPLPPCLECARSLAAHKDYVCVEVYVGKMVAIGFDGKGSIVR
jgi:hypothetical protein